MDQLRPTALVKLIEAANRAALYQRNPLARLSAALSDAAVSRTEPGLIIEDLLDGVARVIATRVPLDRQRDTACEVEVRMSEVLAAWELKQIWRTR